MGNPGATFRSIVWNSAKGGFVLAVSSTGYTLAVPKLDLYDTQALIDIHKANGGELGFDKIQKVHGDALRYF